MAWPHEQVQGQPIESKHQARDGRAQTVTRPTVSEKIHAQTRPEQVQQTKETERPTQRQQKINQRGRVKRHGVPLCQQGSAAIVIRIPKRQFASPETLALKVSQI